MLVGVGLAGCGVGDNQPARPAGISEDKAARFDTRTPIKHLVVIFGENISFDHYFGTYPQAANLPEEHPFYAAAQTPPANTLASPLDPAAGFVAMTGVDLLLSNPNFRAAGNGADATNPFRLGPAQASTADMNHGYTVEQLAANDGAMDLFPAYGGWTLIGDTDPLGDVCSVAGDQNTFRGRNIGDLLNARGITWGWFQGGFDLGVTNADGSSGCGRASRQTAPEASIVSLDYVPHHQPFQYYASTANPTHARPSSVGAIGHTFAADGVTRDPANHQYDSHDFFDAVRAGNMPAVSYLKAPAFQDGHASYSNPIDEQGFLTAVVAVVQASREWASTAIVLAYDDSDGWYDHQAPPIVNPSTGAADALNGSGFCNHGAGQGTATPATPLNGADGKPARGRCGYGTRLPLLVLSPFARKNHIDHTLTDQTSVLRFVEDNWLAGERIQPGGSFDTIAGPLDNMFQF